MAEKRYRKKDGLPAKMCPVCERPFDWRKKWAKNWETVKYCSDRCRGRAKSDRASARDA
ncbi:MAG: DUF2256 domain-containing protein [Pseudomonadota bacterium]